VSAGRRAAARPGAIGVFGGTFDPPHIGHLALAEWAREQLRLERVLFVPAARPPHKRRAGLSPVADRLAMTRLAVRGNQGFAVSTLELDGAGPSFTVDTLRALRQRAPHARLYLLLGADSLDEFRTWRHPEQILGLATLAVARRPGAGARSRAWTAGAAARRVVWIENPAIDVSSSLLRARARAGRSLRYLVPERVAHYIARHGLYRARMADARSGAGTRTRLRA
jgi:nicotinate-nucleotide adenylyltransferase